MTKKHFIAMADYIAILNQTERHMEARACFHMVCAVQDNSAFNKSLFFTACGFPVQREHLDKPIAEWDAYRPLTKAGRS